MTTVTPMRRRRGPLTKEERIERDLKLEQLRAEGRKALRYPADTRLVMLVLLVIAAAVGVAGFIVSFSGLYGASEWAVGKSPALQVAAPLMLDLAIIAITIRLFVEHERGDSGRLSRFFILLFATVSGMANILHTLSVSTATTLPQLIIGCVISGGAPFLLAFVSDVVGGLVFRKPGASA